MRHLAAALAAIVLLGACAAPEPRPLPDLPGVPAAFEMAGRISIRQGERSDIARLRWTHRAGSDQWVFATPLGNEVARIDSGADGATLTHSGDETERAASFAELTRKLLGVALDPRALAGWLHGTAPADEGGWKVAIEETRRAGNVDLARRITAERGDVVVRLVVDDYRALPE